MPCCHDATCASAKPALDNLRWRRALWIALAVNAGFFLAEIMAGAAAGSAALQADALDFLGDAANYAISLGVVGLALVWRSRAALLKGWTLIGLALWVLGSTAWHAWFGTLPRAEVMDVVGTAALLANGSIALMLYRFRTGDANMRSVWVCSRNDAIGNFAVMLAAAGVFGTNTGWPDVIVAAIMGGLGLSGGLSIVRQARSELRRRELSMSVVVGSSIVSGHDHHGPEHSHDDHDHHDHSAHGHGHAHGPGGHHHHQPPAGFDGAFALGAALNAGFVITEVVFGLAAHSVALLADAAHNLGDVLGLLLAWGAVWLGRRRPTRERTYGYGRSSILASLTNAVVLLVSVGAIAVEAVQRLVAGVPSGQVGGTTVMVVAGAGILVNGVTARLFARGRKGDLNVRGAFLHMAADAAVSAGVVVAGLVILLTGWAWLDPLVSLGIAALILVSTWGLLRDSVNLALDKVPEGVNADRVQAYLTALPGVTEVHDLHIWGLSTTETALTAHLVRPGKGTDDALLRRVCDELRDRFGVGHSTFQVEEGDPTQPCALAPEHVI